MESKNIEDFTDEFAVEDVPADNVGPSEERETDPHRLAQRQKQIDFGKNTVGYQRYTQEVPKSNRGKQHPRTPDVHQKCSKRAFDGQVKKWRRMLHTWDLPDAANPTDASKNVKSQRQAAGLPLKMPSAIRLGNNKRGRPSFLNALLSPTMAPPAGKVHKTAAENGAAVQSAEGESAASHPSNALMKQWRDLATTATEDMNGGDSADLAEMITDVEVSYSEDEAEDWEMVQHVEAEPIAA